MIPAKDIIEAIKPFQDSAALEKPLREKRQTAKDVMRYADVVLWMDVVAAVKKHRDRFWCATNNDEEITCDRCNRHTRIYAVEGVQGEEIICRDCAIEEDFGKV